MTRRTIRGDLGDTESRDGGEGDDDFLPESPQQTVLPAITARRAPTNAITEDERELFIVHLGRTGQFNQASYSVGRSPGAFRKLAMEDPGFCVEVSDALGDYAEMLQGEVLRRAYTGIIKPKFGRVGEDQDGVVGWERVYSDRLLELEIKAANKVKYYPPAQSDATGDDGTGGPRTGVALLPARSKSHAEWERDHGDAARGKLAAKVTKPVVPRTTPKS